MFPFQIIKDHFKTYGQSHVTWGSVCVLIFEQIFTIVFVSLAYSFSTDSIKNGLPGVALSAVSLYASVLIAVLIQLHSQIRNLYSEHDVIIKRNESNTLHSERTIGLKRIHFESKANGSRMLFVNLVFCVSLSFSVSAILGSQLLFSGVHNIGDYIFCLATYLLVSLVVASYRVIRSMYYLMVDDFFKIPQ